MNNNIQILIDSIDDDTKAALSALKAKNGPMTADLLNYVLEHITHLRLEIDKHNGILDI